MIEFGYATHRGLSRQYNEDTYLVDTDVGFFLVADGMGGGLYGMRAASRVREIIYQQVRAGRPPADALRQASRSLLRDKKNSPDAPTAGSTATALILSHTGFSVTWVGSSRAYLYADDLRELTAPADLRVLRSRAIVTLDEDETGALAHNNATQALGITPADKLCIHTARGQIPRGGHFLLCSDGLTDVLPRADLQALLPRHDISAQETADQLLLAALAGGASDNITIVIACCDG